MSEDGREGELAVVKRMTGPAALPSPKTKIWISRYERPLPLSWCPPRRSASNFRRWRLRVNLLLARLPEITNPTDAGCRYCCWSRFRAVATSTGVRRARKPFGLRGRI